MNKTFLSLAVSLLLLAPGAGRAADWLSTSRPIGAVAEVAADVEGGVAHWSKPRPDGTTEHLAALTSAGALLVFSQGSSPVFQREDVTARTGVAVRGTPLAWPGLLDREHVAAINRSTGALMLFTWTPATGWTVSDLPGGRTFTGHLARWITPPTTENLAATTSAGEVLVFRRDGGNLFTLIDVTAESGGFHSRGLGGGWSIAGSFEDHLAALGSDGKLYELVSGFDPPQTWRPRPIPLPAAHEPTPDLTAWLSGRENVALRTARNALVVVSRSLNPLDPAWVTADLTALSGDEVTGRPTLYPVTDPDPPRPPQDALAVPARNDRALVFWRTHWGSLWQRLDLTELTGAPLAGTPAAWSPDAVAGTGSDRRLRLVSGFTEARTLIDRVSRPFESLQPQTGVRKTLTLLWHPLTTAANCRPGTISGCQGCDPSTQIGQGFPQFPQAAAEAVLQRAAGYFRENGGGLLTLVNDKTLGWFSSQKPFAHYAEAHGPGRCKDGWDSGEVEKLAEAVRQADAADPALDFSTYDADRNGQLSANELTVIVMIPAAGAGGFVRTFKNGDNPRLEVDGVEIPAIVELDVAGGAPHLGLLARELSRFLFGHLDMSWGPPAWLHPNPPSTALGALALMDRTQFQGHHDAFTKLKLGWLVPSLIWRTGPYTLPDVETRHGVRILVRPDSFRPDGSGGEFLILENRFRAGTFDQGLPADGLAIYHVFQDYRNLDHPPLFLNNDDWLQFGDWGHRAVWLLRPPANGGSSSSYDDAQSLWRRDTGFNLEPFALSRERTWLRMGDRRNPEVALPALRNISAAGREMTFTVATVPLRELCTIKDTHCNVINDLSGLSPVDCGTCQGFDSCGGGDTPNACGCTPRGCGPFECGGWGDGCGGVLLCECPPGWECDPSSHCARCGCAGCEPPCTFGDNAGGCPPC